MGKLASTDLALLTARLGCARLGASRLGFVPFDVRPSYPCDYMWREVKPPTTQWTLLTEGVVCGQRPIARFTMTGETITSIVEGTVSTEGIGWWVGGEVTMTVDGVAWPGGSVLTDGDGFYEFVGVPGGVIVVFASTGTNTGVTIPPATLTLNIVLPPV